MAHGNSWRKQRQAREKHWNQRGGKLPITKTPRIKANPTSPAKASFAYYDGPSAFEIIALHRKIDSKYQALRYTAIMAIFLVCITAMVYYFGYHKIAIFGGLATGISALALLWITLGLSHAQNELNKTANS